MRAWPLWARLRLRGWGVRGAPWHERGLAQAAPHACVRLQPTLRRGQKRGVARAPCTARLKLCCGGEQR